MGHTGSRGYAQSYVQDRVLRTGVIPDEARLKRYWASPDVVGEAPPLLEARRQTTT